MKILIVAYNYPSKYGSTDFVFVKMLVDEFARQGHDCMVIAPHSITHNKCFHRGIDEYGEQGSIVRVVRPNYVSTSNLQIGKYFISNILHKWAVRRTLHHIKFNPDVVYCHFWKQGIEAYPYAKKHNLPLFVASGECEIFEDNRKGELDDFCNYVKGVICVSTKNKEESIKLNLTVPSKCVVAPNSINNDIFNKLDKKECRIRLGLPLDKFIIAFVGSFANRKGTLRVSDAIKRSDSEDIYSLFIGAGADNPDCKNILLKDRINHDMLPYYLNSADAFVLPTLQEGCCNAIVEALACGLPVISSNLPFNWDILDENNSIMVDPEDVCAISNAIMTLKNNIRLRHSMSEKALDTAKNLSISSRAKRIIEFIQLKTTESV